MCVVWVWELQLPLPRRLPLPPMRLPRPMSGLRSAGTGSRPRRYAGWGLGAGTRKPVSRTNASGGLAKEDAHDAEAGLGAL